MKKLSYVVVLTILAMLLLGCGHDQDKVVIKYCKALGAGKVDEAVSFLSRDAKQMLENVGGKSRLAEVGGQFKQRKGIKSIDVTRRKVVGNTATVEFVYKFKDGSKIADFFPLVKEDGVWKIAK
jgi:Domain of unknown function (DUF4878)